MTKKIDITDLEGQINELRTAVEFYIDLFFENPDPKVNMDRLLLVQDVVRKISIDIHADYYIALEAYFAERKASKVTELKQVA
jgi:hypothetical protein